MYPVLHVSVCVEHELSAAWCVRKGASDTLRQNHVKDGVRRGVMIDKVIVFNIKCVQCGD